MSESRARRVLVESADTAQSTDTAKIPQEKTAKLNSDHYLLFIHRQLWPNVLFFKRY